MAKFTKGPWVVIERRSIQATFHGEMAQVATMSHSQWSDPEQWKTAELRESLDANANLIAAAPELYYALKCMIDDLPSKRDWLDPVTEAIAKQALAKADGTENGE